MASEQQFCLRWNNHQSTLVAVFDTLLESGTLVDCTLAAEGQYLKAHKVVLSACSPYFELLLSQHNEKHPIVILKDVKFQELKAMMDYMYRGEVNISQDQLGALLKAAESLQIKGLSDSGGGNDRETSDRRHSRKEVAPQPPQARSPPLPHSTGLTIEHRRSAQQAAPPVVELPEDSPPGTGPHIGGSREGSVSPIPRKRKRHRRRSSTGEEGTQGLLTMTDSHDQTSSSCELPPQSQPAPAANIPAIISPVVPTPSAISRAASDPLSIGPEEQTEPELKRSSLPSSQPNISAEVLPPDPEPVQKLEPPSEILLEPKSEYLDDTMNEDSVENLTTLDDVDDMDDARPGPSHGGEGSSNQGSGFAPWHVRATERTTDEVFMAAQEAVGAHRDSQGAAAPWEEGGALPVEVHISEAPLEPFVCGACGRRFKYVQSLRDHWHLVCSKLQLPGPRPPPPPATPRPPTAPPAAATATASTSAASTSAASTSATSATSTSSSSASASARPPPLPPPPPTAPPASGRASPEAQAHRCPGCGRGYKYAASLRDHWNLTCGRGGLMAAAVAALHAQAQVQSRLPFVCPACGQGHPDEPALRHHLAVACAGRAGAALPCPLCGRTCETVRALCQHLAAECEGRGSARGPLPCPACGQPCAELRAHLENSCTQRPQFWCPRCPYSSVQLGSLRRHARARHGCDL